AGIGTSSGRRSVPRASGWPVAVGVAPDVAVSGSSGCVAPVDADLVRDQATAAAPSPAITTAVATKMMTVSRRGDDDADAAGSPHVWVMLCPSVDMGGTHVGKGS